MTAVIANFGPRGQAVVDDEDYEALKAYPYRMDCNGIVVRSAASPRYKRNVSLARDVGDRIGLPADRDVGCKDGNPLNCTRANLVSAKRRRSTAGIPRVLRSQPPGVHRVKSRAARERELASVPPAAYVIYWHPGPCMKSGGNCMLAREGAVYYLGTAARVTARTASGRPKPAGWQLRPAGGPVQDFGNYFDGVEWLLERYQARQAAA